MIIIIVQSLQNVLNSKKEEANLLLNLKQLKPKFHFPHMFDHKCDVMSSCCEKFCVNHKCTAPNL